MEKLNVYIEENMQLAIVPFYSEKSAKFLLKDNGVRGLTIKGKDLKKILNNKEA